MTRRRHSLASIAAALMATVTFVAAPRDAASAATKVTVAMHYHSGQQKIMERLFEEYERANPDVDLVYQQISYKDYLQTILTARMGGQRPDVYHLYSPWGGKMVQGRALAEPPAMIEELIKRDFVQSATDAIKVEGKVWGPPTEVSNYLLVYNKAHLAELGMTAPPATWDEFTKTAVALTKRDPAGRAQRAGFGFGETPARVAHTFLAHLYSNGGRLLTDDGKTGIASEQAVATLEQAVALAKSGATDPALTGVNTENGTVSMAMRASWTRANFREVMGPDFAQKIGVAPIPAGADWRTVAYAFFYAVDARSPAKDESWKLIAWLNTPRADGKGSPMGEVLANLGALTGSRADLAAHPEVYADPFTKPFVDALERSVPEPTHPATREMEAALQRAVERALRGESTARDALQTAAAEIDGLLAQSE